VYKFLKTAYNTYVIEVSDEQFADSIERAFDRLPKAHRNAVKNVAIVYADEPTPEQRVQLVLRSNQTLFGLYEGVPLSNRGGVTSYGPDKITIFKLPICMVVNTSEQLDEQVWHTLWHEVAHYFGLSHDDIHRRESN